MKLIGFIGYSEKIDLVCSYAKVINMLGKTTLVIDATLVKKYKYCIPSIESRDDAFLTRYDGVDYAVGFESMNDVENYLCDNKVNINLYDYIIVDIDDAKQYEFFRTKVFDKRYFVFDTNIIALKKNKEIIEAVKIYNKENIKEENNKIKKILYRAYMTRASEKYFNNELEKDSDMFEENYLELLDDEQDKMLFLDSLISGYMNLKKHSKMFITTLCELIRDMEPENDIYSLKKIIKKGGVSNG